jgi:hypothetical protein
MTIRHRAPTPAYSPLSCPAAVFAPGSAFTLPAEHAQRGVCLVEGKIAGETEFIPLPGK